MCSIIKYFVIWMNHLLDAPISFVSTKDCPLYPEVCEVLHVPNYLYENLSLATAMVQCALNQLNIPFQKQVFDCSSSFR